MFLFKVEIETFSDDSGQFNPIEIIDNAVIKHKEVSTQTTRCKTTIPSNMLYENISNKEIYYYTGINIKTHSIYFYKFLIYTTQILTGICPLKIN